MNRIKETGMEENEGEGIARRQSRAELCKAKRTNQHASNQSSDLMRGDEM
jgi:hypothetical protein